jgi:hypothetical protein
VQQITTIFETDSNTGKAGVLGIDDDAKLYWNGQRIVTEQKLKLSWWVNLSVVIGGLSTAVIAVYTVLVFYKP